MRLAPCNLLACLAFVFLASSVFGCGNQDDSTPIACLEGAGAYEKALRRAPAAVRLQGGTPISDCLASNQEAGDLEQVGEAVVEVATNLNAKGREEPDSDAALRLGYLIGAAQRGAADSEGIQSDLLRRLAVAARFAPDKQPLPPGFFAHYREGFDAGRVSG